MKFLVYFPCRICNKDVKVSNVVVNLEVSYIWGKKVGKTKAKTNLLDVIPND